MEFESCVEEFGVPSSKNVCVLLIIQHSFIHFHVINSLRRFFFEHLFYLSLVARNNQGVILMKIN